MVRVLDLQQKGRRLDRLRFQATTLLLEEVVHTHTCLCPSSKFGTGQVALMPCGWKSNRVVWHRNGHVLQTSVVDPPTGSWPKGDEHHVYKSLGNGSLVLYLQVLNLE